MLCVKPRLCISALSFFESLRQVYFLTFSAFTCKTLWGCVFGDKSLLTFSVESVFAVYECLSILFYAIRQFLSFVF